MVRINQNHHPIPKNQISEAMSQDDVFFSESALRVLRVSIMFVDQRAKQKMNASCIS